MGQTWGFARASGVLFAFAVAIKTFFISSAHLFHHEYGAQNEAYKMMEGRKVVKVFSLQRVMRSLMVEAPQNETFTLV